MNQTYLDLKTPEINFAIHIVVRAAALARRVQSQMITTSAKEDRSPVTVADFAIQALVAAQLETTFPEYALIAEESSEMLRSPTGREMLDQVIHFLKPELPGLEADSLFRWIDRGSAQHSRRYWVLDPIDGTKGFLRAGQYAVALALMEDDHVVLGVLGCPQLDNANGESGILFAAQSGQGTWSAPLSHLQGSAPLLSGSFLPQHVSHESNPQNARLLRSFEAGHTNVGKIDRLAALLNIQAAPQRLDSQAKYAILAAGSGEAILRLPPHANPNYKEKLWDIAAGAIIVEEAGGQVSDLDGKPLDYSIGRLLANNRGVIATNGKLHETFLRALEQIQA